MFILYIIFDYIYSSGVFRLPFAIEICSVRIFFVPFYFLGGIGLFLEFQYLRLFFLVPTVGNGTRLLFFKSRFTFTYDSK